jgi:hypothetical protein
MAAAECRGIATDTAYAECERRLSQELADQRLSYIVRSQVIGRPGLVVLAAKKAGLEKCRARYAR